MRYDSTATACSTWTLISNSEDACDYTTSLFCLCNRSMVLLESPRTFANGFTKLIMRLYLRYKMGWWYWLALAQVWIPLQQIDILHTLQNRWYQSGRYRDCEQDVSIYALCILAFPTLKSMAFTQLNILYRLNLRIFNDPKDNDKMWKASVKDVDGEILCVSQFTLLANTTKGNKPDFHRAMVSTTTALQWKLVLSVDL